MYIFFFWSSTSDNYKKLNQLWKIAVWGNKHSAENLNQYAISEQEILIPFHSIDLSTQAQNFLPDVTLTREPARVRRLRLFCTGNPPDFQLPSASALARLCPFSGAVRADRSMLCPSFFSCLRLTVQGTLLHKMHCYCRVHKRNDWFFTRGVMWIFCTLNLHVDLFLIKYYIQIKLPHIVCYLIKLQ